MLTAEQTRMFETHLPTAQKLAARVAMPQQDSDALATDALIKAVQAYDPARGPFKSCLRTWVRCTVRNDRRTETARRACESRAVGEQDTTSPEVSHVEIGGRLLSAEEVTIAHYVDALRAEDTGLAWDRYVNGLHVADMAAKYRAGTRYMVARLQEIDAALRALILESIV